jgi:formate-dependent nitrite reductase membrane component NrfD
VIGLGLVVPLLLGWPFAGRSEMQTIFVVTVVLAVLRLIGDYLFRFLVIRAGMYDPLL